MIIVYMSILFILGLLLGNLYTKIGITLGKKESILRINFGCDSCSHRLNIFERLYIFRLFTNKGRCKYCNEKIYTSSAFFELLTGILFSLSLYVNRLSDNTLLNTIFYILFFSVLIVIMVSDYHHMIIPDTTLVLLSIIIIIFKVLIGFYNEELVSIMDAGYMIIFMFIDFIIIFGIMYIMQKISNMVFKSNTLGFGDVKLMGVLALILGYKMSLVCLFISCFMALPIAIYNLQKKDKKILPFGPYIALGTIIIMLFNINFDMIIDFIKR